MKSIEFLPIDGRKVLKVIQIDGPEWNKFRGYLPYTRIFNPTEYDYKAGDIIDENIISAIQHYFPTTFLRYNVEIIFKGQLEDYLRTLEGGSRKKITIQFFPDISYELLPTVVGRTFYAYPRDFEIRLLIGGNNESAELINGFYMCSLPYDILDEIIKTINSI